jgi:hypothetical protein
LLDGATKTGSGIDVLPCQGIFLALREEAISVPSARSR